MPNDDSVPTLEDQYLPVRNLEEDLAKGDLNLAYHVSWWQCHDLYFLHEAVYGESAERQAIVESLRELSQHWRNPSLASSPPLPDLSRKVHLVSAAVEFATECMYREERTDLAWNSSIEIALAAVRSAPARVGRYEAPCMMSLIDTLCDHLGFVLWNAEGLRPLIKESFAVMTSEYEKSTHLLEDMIFQQACDKTLVAPLERYLKDVLKDYRFTHVESELKLEFSRAVAYRRANQIPITGAEVQKGADTPLEAPTRVSKIDLALAVLSQNPEWTNLQIAEKVGCHAKTLSNSKLFQHARQRIRLSGYKFPRAANDRLGRRDALDAQE